MRVEAKQKPINFRSIQSSLTKYSNPNKNQNMTAIIDQTLGLKYKNLDLITCVEPIGLRTKNKESYESIGS